MKHIGRMIGLAVLLILSGCNTPLATHLFGSADASPISSTLTYHVYVNSINDGSDSRVGKYVIISGLQGLSESDLEFKEYAGYVRRAMNKAGFTEANGKEDADIGVLLAYGIGDPEKVVSYKTNTYISDNAYVSGGSYYSYGGVASSVTTPNVTVTYTRSVILDAFDYRRYRESGEEIQLWKTEAYSTGVVSDLRVVLPVMVTAIVPYIGSNTYAKKKLVIRTPSEELYEIMGLPQPSN